MVLRTVARPLVLIALTLVLFDGVAWFAAPEDLTGFAGSYRKPYLLDGPLNRPEGGTPYPPGYFRADDVMGFDIAPGARMTHVFDANRSVEVFANELGCFDRNAAETFRGKPYAYFAGDSFTWGFADYDNKFATVWEARTGKLAAKCGVTHTGQAHQLEKLAHFARAVGHMPATVFVGYVSNDPANDRFHPHTTVVDGYLVDTAFLRDGGVHRPPRDELERAVRESVRALEAPRSPFDRARTAVWVYSLSANIVNEGARSLLGLHHPARSAPRSRFGENLYSGYNAVALKAAYLTDPRSEANREAIARWAAHARENGYRLVFILIPPREAFDDTELYAQVRSFLGAKGIEYLDLAALFKAGGLRADDLYWKGDPHLSDAGNRIVGELLAQRY